MDGDKRRRALRAGALLLGLGALFCLVVLLWRPPCQILRITGWYCPGCGGQRMFWALLRGDLPGAFRQNALLFCLLLPAAVYAAVEAVRYVQKKRPLYKSRRFLVILAVVTVLSVAFGVLRNLPGFSFLAPVA